MDSHLGRFILSMESDPNYKIWLHTKKLSKPFWDFYSQAIGFRRADSSNTNDEEHDIHIDDLDLESGHIESEEDNNCDASVNDAYLEFIKITRAHQAEREKLKKQKKKTEEVLEEYYKDISQVNTLVEDNLARVPNKEDTEGSAQQQEAELVKLYGSREAYENIRSMEMYIDEQFRVTCLEQSPHFWPAIPINTKPYLNAKR